MNIKKDDIVKCKDSNLKNYIENGSFYNKELTVAKVRDNTIYLHTEDMTDYYICHISDILYVVN